MSFNGVMKYVIYVFMGAWLFLLGVMAGRGTAPVTFETRPFQERLKTIVDTYKDPDTPGDPDKKIALNYSDALSDETGIEEMVIPVPAEHLSDTPADSRHSETVLTDTEALETRVPDPAEDIPVKTSLKAATRNKSMAKPVAENSGKATAEELKTLVWTGETEKPVSEGRYTIQVAAFKSFRDAVTQMATLEKKGFASTRTTREMDGITWYRVRIGEFSSRDAAARYLEQLNQAGINGMIITKE